MREVDKSKFIFRVLAVVEPDRLITLRVNLANNYSPHLPTIPSGCDLIHSERSPENSSAATDRYIGIWLVI